MDELLTAVFENGSDLEKAVAAFRQLGLLEVEHFKFPGEGFAMEPIPASKSYKFGGEAAASFPKLLAGSF